jgi:hypothetical protein
MYFLIHHIDAVDNYKNDDAYNAYELLSFQEWSWCGVVFIPGAYAEHLKKC